MDARTNSRGRGRCLHCRSGECRLDLLAGEQDLAQAAGRGGGLGHGLGELAALPDSGTVVRAQSPSTLRKLSVMASASVESLAM